MSINFEKRSKKFNNEFTEFKTNPFYGKIKDMYVSGEIKMLPSAANLFKKVKVNKTTNKVKKGAIKAVEAIEAKIIENKVKVAKKINQEIKTKLNKQIIEKSKPQNILQSNIYKSHEITINKQFLRKHNDTTQTPFYNFDGFNKVKSNSNAYYIQTVTYYDENNNKLSGNISKSDINIDVTPKIFQTSNIDKKFNHMIFFEMTPYDYHWTPRIFINNIKKGGYVKIKTTSYNILVKNKVSASEIIQIYRDNDSGTCLYDGVLDYFFVHIHDNRKYKTIYNKLVSEEGLLYKKEYTNETIIDLCKFIESTIIIKDLINGEDRVFKVENSRYTIEFLNTKINHLDRLVNNHIVEEVDFDEMQKIKKDSSFYIEKFGQVITPFLTYKLKDTQFQTVYKKWKKKVHYSSNFINKNDDEYKMVAKYDYNMHRFFNKNMDIDNNCKKEGDLIKAYYNYSDINYNQFYKGVPSGSFINMKITNNFTIETFNEHYKNNLIGFYEVKIIKINEKEKHFKVLGFNVNSNYVLTSAMIQLLKSSIDFEFLNISFSPSVHMPFNKDFLKCEETHDKKDILEETEELDIEEGNTILNNDNYRINRINNKIINNNERLDNLISNLTRKNLSTEEYTKINNKIESIKLDIIRENEQLEKSKYEKDQPISNNNNIVFTKSEKPIISQKSKKGLKYYCKAFGLMFLDNEEIITNVKPLQQDMEYYKLLQNDKYEMTRVDDIIKIIQKNEEPKTRIHIAMYIHSYIKTLIINQLLTMDIDKVHGVKLDSIVCDNDCDINNPIFSDKECNIEKLLKRPNTSSLDFGLDIKQINEDEDHILSSYSNSYILSNNEDDLNFQKSFLQTGEVITSRIVFLEGMGGSGKTHSIIHSSINSKNICYTTACWNLIQSKKVEVPGLIGYSLQKLTGVGLDGKKCEVVTNYNIKIYIVDEMTLNKKSYIELIFKNFPGAFIFLIGDMDKNMIYQCTMPNIEVYNPSDIKNIQKIVYTKNYRFDNELNEKLLKLREFQRNNVNDYNKNILIDNYVKKEFKQCFYKKRDITINKNDMCISSVNDTSELDNYFFNKGTAKRYFVKNTEFCKGLYKGAEIFEEPSHNNYTMTLFKSIHSSQGLTSENNLIINNTYNFDYNLWYTALSRAKSLNQIKIII